MLSEKVAPPAGPETVDYPGEDLNVLSASKNYYRWIVDLMEPYVSGHTVEYGAGIGTMSQRLRPHVERLTLVEPASHLAARLKTSFSADSSVEVLNTTLERHAPHLPSGSVNAFVMVNVLEHIEDDAQAVRWMFDALAPGGKLALFVPALPWLMSDLDRAHGHFRRYRKADLVRLMDMVGAEIEFLRFFDLPGILPWWLLNTVMGKVDFNLAAVRLFDSVVIPPARWLETRFPPPIGKNLVMVAHKR
jgi:SAM-dependent methyltransferase